MIGGGSGMHEELVRKIAEWRFGKDGIFVSEDGKFLYRRTKYIEEDDEHDLELLEDLTEDLSACFKWLMLPIKSVHFAWGEDGCLCWFYARRNVGRKYEALAEASALALCRAFEKMIDAGEECCDSQTSSLQAAS